MLEPYDRPFKVNHGGACVCGGYGHNHENRPKIVRKFEPPPLPESYTQKERSLELFFGIKSIELTPENPEYECRACGFDEFYFEPIVPTMSICLEQWNISKVRFQFRALVGDIDHFRGKYSFFPDPGREGFGGYCTMAPRRAVSWPASIQHRIDTFELANRSQNGRLTLLSLYLVDPSVRIRSTATVPLRYESERLLRQKSVCQASFLQKYEPALVHMFVDSLGKLL